MVEGEIAAKAMVEDLAKGKAASYEMTEEEKAFCDNRFEEKMKEYDKILTNQSGLYDTEQLEEAMQKVMDTYAGGISNHYQFNENQLNLAEEKIEKLKELSKELGASNMHELMFVYELKNRLTVCETLIYHLRARKETRWHSFAENLDYPDKSDEWLKYVNTRKENGKIHVLFRELVKRGETYEHSY